MPSSCANCQHPVDASFRYCPGCGQPTGWRRFTLRAIAGSFFRAFTDLDRGIPYLLRGLAVAPGTVAREYVLEGKRKKYVNPFTFLLLVLGLYLSVNAFTHPYTREPGLSVRASRQPAPPAGDGSIRERQRQVQGFVEGYTNLLSLLAIPLLSGVYYAAFRRYRVHYAEHLVANVFFAGFYAVVGLLATGVLALLLRRFLGLLNPLLLLFQWAYLSVAYCGFLGFRRRGQYLASAAVTGLALLTWIALSSGLIYLYIRYGLPAGGGA